MLLYSVVFMFMQKTAFELRISAWSSDVCSSDLVFASRLRCIPLEETAHLAWLLRGCYPVVLTEAQVADIVREFAVDWQQGLKHHNNVGCSVSRAPVRRANGRS